MSYSDLTVIVPAFNEAQFIQGAVLDLLAALPGAQVIVVDNNSKDETSARVRELAAENVSLLLCLKKGKGAAMRQGLATCTRPYVLFHDADGEYRAKDSVRLVSWIRGKNDAMAVGNRMFSVGRPPWNSLFACGLIRKALSLRHNVRLGDQDILSGTRVAPLDVWKDLDLTSTGFSIETEIVKKCVQTGIRLQGFPVGYSPRTKTEGKKIRSWDLISLLRVALR